MAAAILRHRAQFALNKVKTPLVSVGSFIKGGRLPGSPRTIWRSYLFLTLLALASGLPWQAKAQILINEIMAANVATAPLQTAPSYFPDYVELYNYTTNDIDLGLEGYCLTDDIRVPTKFRFPLGTVIAADSFLLVFCDSQTNLLGTGSTLHTGFALSAKGGETLAIYRTNASFGTTTFICSNYFGIQVPGYSVGRIPSAQGDPNSSASFTLNLPTPCGIPYPIPSPPCLPNLAARFIPAPTTSNQITLKINEWLATNSAGVDEDWIELYNPDTNIVELSGVVLIDNEYNSPIGAFRLATIRAVPALSFIAAKGYVQFFASGLASRDANHLDFSLSSGSDIPPPSPGNPLDRIYLFGPSRVPSSLIDKVECNLWRSRDISEGRLPDGQATILTFPNPSPEGPNFGRITNVVISELLSHSDPPLEDAVKLHNLTVEPVDISYWWLSDAKDIPRKYQFPPGTIIPPHGYHMVYEYQFNDPINHPGTAFGFSSLLGDECYLHQADATGRLTGYRTGVDFGPADDGVSFIRYVTSDNNVEFVASSDLGFGTDVRAGQDANRLAIFRTGTGAPNNPPRIGPVIINEIHYHPPDVFQGGVLVDNALDEFVELRNIDSNSIPLFYAPRDSSAEELQATTNGWRLRGVVDFDFPGLHTGLHHVMAPNTYVLLVNFDPDEPTNATLRAQFTARYNIPTATKLLGPYTKRLSNSSGEVSLLRPGRPQRVAASNTVVTPYVLIDRVVYADASPWPTNSTDGGGYSLQRASSFAFGNDPVNWAGAAPSPGRVNPTVIRQPPYFLTQPSSPDPQPPGGSVGMDCLAGGDAPLIYRWYFNGLFTGVVGNRLLLTAISVAQSGDYYCVVSNSVGMATSQVATVVVVVRPPAVIQAPQSLTAAVGTMVGFSVVADGTSPLSYQWRRNSATLSDSPTLTGAQSPSLWLSNLTTTAAGNYDVVVVNPYGSVTSSPAQLTVIVPPVVLSQPSSLLGTLGGTATFRVLAGGGDGPLSYQWQKNGLQLPHATNTWLTLSNLQPVDLGGYSVRVASSSGSITSAVATLTLNNVNIGEWAGLVAWYPFTGGFLDASSYANHAIPGTVSLTLDRHRQPDRAVLLAGTSQSHLEIPDNGALQSIDYSVSLWFNAQRLPPSSIGAAMLLSKGAGNCELQLGSPLTGPAGIRFSPRPGTGPWDAPAGSYFTNTWNHLVAIWAPSMHQVRLYLNGRELALTGPSPVAPGADLGGPSRLGTRSGEAIAGTQPFQGRLDEVRIYARALPRQDVQALYESDSPDSDGDGLSDAYEQGFGRYDVVQGALTWWQAKTEAEMRGGHLATITSSQEWDCIQSIVGARTLSATETGPLWLGATDESQEGRWRWVTEEAWQYERWLPGQPSAGFVAGSRDYLLTDADLEDGPGWADAELWPVPGLQGYLLEFGYYTDPLNWDTDLDGFGDGEELTAGSSPVDPASVPSFSPAQFFLSATTPGGGLVLPEPFLNEYPSNRLVQVTATPAPGWVFLGWQGDAQGNSTVQPIVMSQSRCLQGIFGTALTRNAIGNGAIRILPEAAAYPYATPVTLVAEPQPGHYFVRWSNAVAGVQNPRTYTTLSSNPQLTAHFAALDPGSYALTLIPNGAGRVSASPQTNRYPAGTQVSIQAYPDAGQAFIGWSGDAAGLQNPLVTTMDRSRTITAVFTRRARLEVFRCFGQVPPGTFSLLVSGQLGERYTLQRSPDLRAWSPLGLLTNTLGKAQWNESFSPETGPRCYRVLSAP